MFVSRTVIEANPVAFYASIMAKDIARLLPNVPIIIPPIIKFSLHDLKDDGWRVKIRHNRWKHRPQVCISKNRADNTDLGFRLPHCPLFRTMADAANALECYQWTFRGGHMPLEPAGLGDEVAILRWFNTQRYDRLKKFPREPQTENMVDLDVA